MTKSKLQEDDGYCYVCNKYMYVYDTHHIFNGTANRSKSDEDGMFVYVHRTCHSFIHEHPMTAKTLKMRGQRKWEELYGDREAFIKRYGKSYL